MAELRQVHATHVTSFHIINAIAATISAAEASRLEADPAVSAVVPDAMRHVRLAGQRRRSPACRRRDCPRPARYGGRCPSRSARPTRPSR